MEDEKTMSQIVDSICKIVEADGDTLQKAMEMLCKMNNGTLTLVDRDEMIINCPKLGIHSHKVSIKEKQVVVTGESYGIQDVRESVEQYYEAVVFAEEYGAEVEKDEEGTLLLTLEVDE